MSYGYLIASKKPLGLEKNRRFKFLLIYSLDELYIYSRLEESSELSIRKDDKSVLTAAGKKFFADIFTPYFFIDYLLLDKQSEMNLALKLKENIKKNNYEAIFILKTEEIMINKLYKILK